MSSRTTLQTLVNQIRTLVKESDGSGWSSMDQEEIIHLLDDTLDRLNNDLELNLPELGFLFAPTGPLQELSIDNGWTKEYQELASRFDTLADKIRSSIQNSLPPLQERIQLFLGDITKLEVDCVVTAANEYLCGGGGVDGAVHAAAGPELLRACRALAPCPPGQAVITPGFALKATHVIHAVGPIFKEMESDSKLLASAYQESLRLAQQSAITSIAFPCISTGAFGFPFEQAAKIACQATVDFLGHNELPNKVVFCCFEADDYKVYSEWIENL